MKQRFKMAVGLLRIAVARLEEAAKVIINQIKTLFTRTTCYISNPELPVTYLKNWYTETMTRFSMKGLLSSGSRAALTIALLIVFVTAANGQSITELIDQLLGSDFKSAAGLFGTIDIIYGIVVILGGYLSSFIPFLNKISSGTYRVLVWAIITMIGFAIFGGDILSMSMTYAISTSLYEVVLKWFKKTPNPEEAAAMTG